MALAETFLRNVHKFGLLPKIIAGLPLISVLLAVVSVGWLLVLPMEGQFRNTYISENALMPGQVNSFFRETEWNIVRGFRAETAKWDFDSVSQENPQLESWLADFGLTVSHHHDVNTKNTTMYSLMHAPRGDHTESLVLVVPYFTSDGQKNVGALALAPALARYFSRMSIWAKNIILVFPRDGNSVLRSWVEAYHTSLDVTAGSIDAAIVMEYPSESDYFSFMEIVYEGLNGQLPNLDLMNVATTIARNENIKVSVQGTPLADLEKNDYWSRLAVLAKGILRLAVAGVSRQSYGCEAFSGWQIQALTIRAVGDTGPDVTQFGRIVDSSFRSVNNLLEKFHQSFFFYLMLSPTNFVSIGTYLPSAVLVAASFLVSSLYSAAVGVSFVDFLANIGRVLLLFSEIEAVCLVGAIILQKLAVSASSVYTIIPAVTISLIALTAILSSGVVLSTTYGSRFSRPLSHLILSFALYLIAMLVVSLLIVHFALAFSIGWCAFPLTFIQNPLAESQEHSLAAHKAKLKVALCLFVSSPISVIVVLGYVFNEGKFDGIVSLVQGLLSSWHEMQSWTWFVIALGWLPAWIAVALVSAFGDFSLSSKRKTE